MVAAFVVASPVRYLFMLPRGLTCVLVTNWLDALPATTMRITSA